MCVCGVCVIPVVAVVCGCEHAGVCVMPVVVVVCMLV